MLNINEIYLALANKKKADLNGELLKLKKTIKDNLVYFKGIDEKLHNYFMQSGNPILISLEKQISTYTPSNVINEEAKVKRTRSKSSRKNGIKKLESIDGIKKPCSPFFLFMAQERIKIRAQNPTIQNKEIIRISGERWMALPQEQKDYYCKKHEENKAIYKKSKEILEENHKQDSILSSIVSEKLNIDDTADSITFSNQMNM